MKVGICASVNEAAIAGPGGWDYLEANVQDLLNGLVSDEQWDGLAAARGSPLPIASANCMVPGSLKITGPEADPAKLRQYMSRVLQRAQKVGMKTLVFGSGGARNVPDGFNREKARQQIIEFARSSAQIAREHGVTIVVEPLNSKECNIITSVSEAMTYVKAVDHPSFQCLVDSYHFWLEDEPLENLKAAMPWIKHVHVADRVGRVPAGESGQADYRPFFTVLKQGGYDGLISVEAGFSDIAAQSSRVVQFIRKQWKEASQI